MLGHGWEIASKKIMGCNYSSMPNTMAVLHKPMGVITYTCPNLKQTVFYQLEWVNTLRRRQNGRHFADDILKYIFLNEDIWTSIKTSPRFVSKGPINNIPVLVQKMAWHRRDDKPLSETMVVSLVKHICVTRPQWVNPSIWNMIWPVNALITQCVCRLLTPGCGTSPIDLERSS